VEEAGVDREVVVAEAVVVEGDEEGDSSGGTG